MTVNAEDWVTRSLMRVLISEGGGPRELWATVSTSNSIKPETNLVAITRALCSCTIQR